MVKRSSFRHSHNIPWTERSASGITISTWRLSAGRHSLEAQLSQTTVPAARHLGTDIPQKLLTPTGLGVRRRQRPAPITAKDAPRKERRLSRTIGTFASTTPLKLPSSYKLLDQTATSSLAAITTCASSSTSLSGCEEESFVAPAIRFITLGLSVRPTRPMTKCQGAENTPNPKHQAHSVPESACVLKAALEPSPPVKAATWTSTICTTTQESQMEQKRPFLDKPA
mmetsp:Transcript_54207/g.122596  ORF Transcript_54207/g.122596 Transcript_54207/m.122596 type:complete len:226 (-) Transcript_54207:713-1390(-)